MGPSRSPTAAGTAAHQPQRRKSAGATRSSAPSASAARRVATGAEARLDLHHHRAREIGRARELVGLEIQAGNIDEDRAVEHEGRREKRRGALAAEAGEIEVENFRKQHQRVDRLGEAVDEALARLRLPHDEDARGDDTLLGEESFFLHQIDKGDVDRYYRDKDQVRGQIGHMLSGSD